MTTEQCAMNFWGRIEQLQTQEHRPSLKQICDNAGIVYRTIENQKSAARLPSLLTAYKLAKELHCSVEWLLSGEITIETHAQAIREISADSRKKEIVEKIASLSQSELFAIEVFLGIRK